MSIKIEGQIGQFINTGKPFTDGSVITSFQTGHSCLTGNKKPDGKNEYTYVNHSFELSSKHENYAELMKLIVFKNTVLIEGYYKVKKGYTNKNTGLVVPDSNVIVVKNIIPAISDVLANISKSASNPNVQSQVTVEEPQDDLPF